MMETDLSKPSPSAVTVFCRRWSPIDNPASRIGLARWKSYDWLTTVMSLTWQSRRMRVRLPTCLLRKVNTVSGLRSWNRARRDNCYRRIRHCVGVCASRTMERISTTSTLSRTVPSASYFVCRLMAGRQHNCTSILIHPWRFRQTVYKSLLFAASRDNIWMCSCARMPMVLVKKLLRCAGTQTNLHL